LELRQDLLDEGVVRKAKDGVGGIVLRMGCNAGGGLETRGGKAAR